MATIPGISDFGTLQTNGGPRGIAKNVSNPGFLVLQAFNGGGVVTDYYLWIDYTGPYLRVSTVRPTDPQNDGTIVGP